LRVPERARGARRLPLALGAPARSAPAGGGDALKKKGTGYFFAERRASRAAAACEKVACPLFFLLLLAACRTTPDAAIEGPRVLPAAHIDVAELDPGVADVARAFFALPQDERLEVHVGDGRAYVHDAAAKWDLVVLDAYGDADIPRHLATVEFLSEVKTHLTAN